MPILILMFSMSLLSFTANSNTIEAAHEARSITVEYYETSKTGKVFTRGCSHCNQSIYDFNVPPIISIDGKNISLKNFIKSPVRNRLGTIIIDQLTNTVLRINF